MFENIERKAREMEEDLIKRMERSAVDFNHVRYPAQSSRYMGS